MYSENFVVIATTVLVIWAPAEFLLSYLDYHVIPEDNDRVTRLLNQVSEIVPGLIASAAIISAGLIATNHETPRFGQLIAKGMVAWPRITATRIITGLAIFVGFLLLIVPGIYLTIRLCLAETVVVVENISATSAMRRSMELTKGRFWFVIGIYMVILICLVLLTVLMFVPFFLLPVIDTWFNEALSRLLIDVVAAYFILCFFGVYRQLANEYSAAADTAKPR